MPSYATKEQLAEYLTGDPAGDVPANATVLLRQASSLVSYAIRAAVYDVDGEGVPTDLTLHNAVTEATCAQAAAWVTNDIDPTKGRAGAAPVVTSKSLGGASVAYSTYAADAAARSDLASGDFLVMEAYRILDRAGLLSARVFTPTGGVNAFPSPWPYDPLTGRAVGKYDDPQFGEIAFQNE